VAFHPGDTTFSFTHARDTLFISLPQDVPAKTVKTIAVTYAGIPADGLIISKNKWGERTFFADNWPDRAHQWIPCNDRPDDKATVDFIVTAPAHYKVISNGVMVAETTNGVAQKNHALERKCSDSNKGDGDWCRPVCRKTI
jgi:hypothetical protein